MLSGTLCTSLLENMLAGKGVKRDKGKIRSRQDF